MLDIPLAFDLRPQEGGGFSVTLAADGESAQAGFAFDLAHERMARVLESIEDVSCSRDDLADVGVGLWTGLMSEEVGALFERIHRKYDLEGPPEGSEGFRYQFRLAIPPALQHLPWEALYFQKGFGFVSSHPNHLILRVPVEDLPRRPRRARRAGDTLRILAVIPSGSGLNVANERHNLELAVAHVRDQVELEFLAGEVTPDRLAARLREGPWDVVHFIGHGEQRPDGHNTVRVNSDEPGQDGVSLDGEVFAALFLDKGVGLAVLNCCLGARPSPLRSLSGLGPYLVRAGVQAVVAMRYEVADSVAIRFSDQFYRELLAGDEPGRVDLAVERAREALFRNSTDDDARSFVTPVLLTTIEPGPLFELRPASRTAAPAVAATAPAAGNLPDVLVDAFKAGKCIPVVGQRVLGAGGTRAGVPGMGLQQLARTLAAAVKYPALHDFDLCEAAGDWMDALVLQRVCQHQVAKKPGEFYRVTQAIQDAYLKAQPPPVLSLITEWDVSGVFYLFFDGLLEEAYVGSRRAFRPVYGVDQPVPPGTGAVLVNVRGAHKNADSLVLTEQDHDRLWDRMASITPEIAELVRGVGRSLLFMGVNPRDPLVKRLTRKLLERASPRTVGPVFFLCREGEKEDPYWTELSAQFPVVWVEGDLVAQVSALTDSVRPA